MRCALFSKQSRLIFDFRFFFCVVHPSYRLNENKQYSTHQQIPVPNSKPSNDPFSFNVAKMDTRKDLTVNIVLYTFTFHNPRCASKKTRAQTDIRRDAFRTILTLFNVIGDAEKVLRSRLHFGLICVFIFIFFNKIMLIYTRSVHEEWLPNVRNGEMDRYLERRRRRRRRFVQTTNRGWMNRKMRAAFKWSQWDGEV